MCSFKLRTFFKVVGLFAIFAMGLFQVAQAAEPMFKVGGAVRYNLLLTDYEDNQITESDGQFTWDTWRLNVYGVNAAGVILDFEYRFYPTFGTHFIHHGYFGYEFNETSEIQVGVQQVPFGDQTWASHSWWFSGAYYMGLEDDYDMGVKYLHSTDSWDFAAAYYYQPEPAGPAPTAVEEWPSYGVGGSGRYSYDIIPSAGNSNRERNQFNGRVAYKFPFAGSTSEVGFSAQFGQLYNSVLDEYGSHSAFALHLDANVNRFNIKAFGIYYNHNSKNDEGMDSDLVYMGAYGSGVYPVAAEAMVYNLGIAYSIPVSFGPITGVQFYDDYTLTDKAKAAFYDTQQNILGCLVSAGSVYTYFDIAMGKNQPWLTQNFGQGLGTGVKDAPWNIRYNINIGYYF